MNFEEYLTTKKIDSRAFRDAEPDRWQEWKVLFEEVSEKSFTTQKLYLINPTRRKYLLKEESPPSTSLTSGPVDPSKPKISKPVFKPKID